MKIHMITRWKRVKVNRNTALELVPVFSTTTRPTGVHINVEAYKQSLC